MNSCRVMFIVGVVVAALGSHAQASDAFVVAPYENSAHIRDIDWMQGALGAMVSRRLETVVRLRPATLPSLPAESVCQNRTTLALCAERLNAHFVVTGRFARPAWKSEIETEILLFDRKTRSLKSVGLVKTVGARENLVSQLYTDLAQALAQAGVVLSAEEKQNFSLPPTADLYALTLWGRGLAALYGLGEPRDLDRAAQVIGRVLFIDPKFTLARETFADILWQRNRTDDHKRALAESRRAVEGPLEAPSAASYLALAERERELGQRSEALVWTDRAVERAPYWAQSHTLQGELFAERGDYDAALTALDRSIAQDATWVRARRARALVYAQKGATREFMEELEVLGPMVPDDRKVQEELAAAYMQQAQWEKAALVYEQLTTLEPRQWTFWKLLGDCHREQHEYEKALFAYQHLQRADPSDPRAYFAIGSLYLQMGQENRAEVFYQQAQQFKRYIGEAFTNLGVLALRRGDVSQALWYLSRAVERAPLRPRAHYNYGVALARKQDWMQAAREFQAAYSLDPEDDVIRTAYETARANVKTPASEPPAVVEDKAKSVL